MKWYLAGICALLLAGCSYIQDVVEAPLTDRDIKNLRKTETQMLHGYDENGQDYTAEVEIDQRISDAVKQMVATLKPEYRRHFMSKYRLGFLEISDIDRQSVSRFHNYVTEKSLTFSFLQPDIARNFNIVERFLLKDVLREQEIENLADPRVVDQWLAKKLGRIYALDVIETGVVTLSDEYADLNLRLIETQRGRIIGVGATKIKITPLVSRWLEEAGYVGVGHPEIREQETTTSYPSSEPASGSSSRPKRKRIRP